MNPENIQALIDTHRKNVRDALWSNNMPSALLHVSIVVGLKGVLRCLQNGPERLSSLPPSFDR